MLKARLWVALVAMTLALSGLGISVMAEPKPSGYVGQEFALGELGAFVGGIIGLFTLCQHFEDSGPGSCNYMYSVLTGREACAGPCLGGNLIGINIGRALGASTGVVLMGWVLGVEGNILAAYLATGLWFISPGLLPFLPGEWREILWAPFVPAIVATIGYNIGAKMKSDKSKPAALSWYLPLVALRF